MTDRESDAYLDVALAMKRLAEALTNQGSSEPRIKAEFSSGSTTFTVQSENPITQVRVVRPLHRR